jgi:hypothetical protein
MTPTAGVRLPNKECSMTIHMTEAELHRLGLTIDPNNASQAVPIKDDELPDESWEFDRLVSYGACAVTESGKLLAEATSLGRKSTVQMFRAGRALSLARSKVPAGQGWIECLKIAGIPRTNAWEAMQLFERAGSEEAVSSLTPTEAKHKFGVTKPKRDRREQEPEGPAIVSFPKTTDEDQDSISSGMCDQEEDLDSDADVDDLGPEDELADDYEEEEGDESSEVDSEEPPVHEGESVLRLLVKVNAALCLAGMMPVSEEDREAVETEVIRAQQLLEEIGVGVG